MNFADKTLDEMLRADEETEAIVKKSLDVLGVNLDELRSDEFMMALERDIENAENSGDSPFQFRYINPNDPTQFIDYSIAAETEKDTENVHIVFLRGEELDMSKTESFTINKKVLEHEAALGNGLGQTLYNATAHIAVEEQNLENIALAGVWKVSIDAQEGFSELENDVIMDDNVAEAFFKRGELDKVCELGSDDLSVRAAMVAGDDNNIKLIMTLESPVSNKEVVFTQNPKENEFYLSKAEYNQLLDKFEEKFGASPKEVITDERRRDYEEGFEQLVKEIIDYYNNKIVFDVVCDYIEDYVWEGTVGFEINGEVHKDVYGYETPEDLAEAVTERANEILKQPVVTICQLPDGEKYHGIRFEGMDELKKEGIKLNKDDYNNICQFRISEFNGLSTLEEIYKDFNEGLPEGFPGHALAVSDVVVVDMEGKKEAYYCDTKGFTKMPEFFKKEKARNNKDVKDLD